jgi:hypothetical protein
MTSTQSTLSACPCESFSFPQVICNPSGLSSIAFRIGDFVAFRTQLLQPLEGETELTLWHPGAQGDLAVQMIEWWAYLADILTFYNERIANESYLQTAVLPESVNHLVQLLGYRPKPALGASGTLAALLTPSARPPVTVPAGLQVQSKPGPGQSPQVFEVDAATTVTAPDVISAVVSPTSLPLLPSGSLFVWLAGKVTGIKAADRQLLINSEALTAQTIADYAWINVGGTSAQTDPLGNPVTQVSFTNPAGTISASAQAADYALLKSQLSSPLWPYPGSPPAISATGLDLASVARGMSAGALILIDVPANAAALAAAAGTAAASALQSAATALLDSPSAASLCTALVNAALAAAASNVAALAASAAELLTAGDLADGVSLATAAAITGAAAAAALTASSSALASQVAANPAQAAGSNGLVPTAVIVQSYSEVVWYANGQGTNPPTSPTPAIGIPHTEISFAPGLSGSWWPFIAAQVTVRWGWAAVGQLVPVLTAAELTYPTGNDVLVPAPGAAVFPTLPVPVLLEDGSGNAVAATAAAASNPATGAILNNITPQPAPSLNSPIDMFFNLLGVSRGKTVASEVLGSGNPSVPGQDFTLAQSPVTYFFDPASVSGPNFSSTVTVWVNGVAWQEQQSFYNQPANVQIFVLREDDQGQTHVTFGDGVNGALLPTGTNNVVASYRYGAGAAAPAAETLTVLLTPTPGLKSVRNPLPPTGGSDPDPPTLLQNLAPQSVLTFNRAVSLDDYAAIALTASGVTQAVPSFAFDPVAQRPVVTLWIAGDSGAKRAATAALAGVAMPNQSLNICQATAIAATLSLTYVRDPRYLDSDVQSGLTTALLDPNAGLFGANVVGIGGTIYQSQIAQVCLAVQGVTAIQDVTLTTGSTGRLIPIIRRFVPPSDAGEAECTDQTYNPGPGNYFSIPNDGQHLVLNGTPAS